LPIIAFGLILLSCGTIGSYVLEYMTTYALNTLHLAAGLSFGALVVTSICGIVVDPISGLLSDRYGRKRIITTGYALMLMCVFPAFWVMNRHPSVPAVYAMMGLMAALFALAAPPVVVALTEALPQAIRSGVVATVYAVTVSMFGGSTQFIITWLIRRALLLGLTAASLMPETAPVKSNASAASPRAFEEPRSSAKQKLPRISA
jgi:MFS transporter, MHS family, citrate/tricarballylate:H+ symporter